MEMEGIRTFLLIILVITIPVLITAYAFRFTAFDEKYYFRFYEKYHIYSQFGSKEEVNENTIVLLDYLKGEDQLTTDFFNEKEKQHLADVKNIMKSLITLSYVSLFLFLMIIIYFRAIRNHDLIFRGFLYGGMLTLALLGIFIALLVIDFHSVFLSFHYLFFNNNLWQLDPATDNLIVMFPNAFFYNIAVKILVSSIVTGAIFTAFGVLFKYFKKHSIRGISHL